MNHTNLIDSIEERLAENKSGVKTYKTYATAYSTAEELATKFETANDTDVGMQFMVVMLPKTQRWTVVFNLSRWIQMSNRGTYLGWFATKGFFSI
jgi:hypothetical protein